MLCPLSIEISKEIELNVGEVYFIDSQFVEWSTTNPDVATVNEKGVVTALKAGEVTITAKNKSVFQYVFINCFINASAYLNLLLQYLFAPSAFVAFRTLQIPCRSPMHRIKCLLIGRYDLVTTIFALISPHADFKL